jgi:hypothetical protein
MGGEILRIQGVASSFVYNNMKLRNDAGSGEAKLFVGARSKAKEFDEFFQFNKGYQYFLKRDNLLEYLQQVKMEYVFQKLNQYKDANIQTWNTNYSVVKNLADEQLKMPLEKFEDSSRYYVRAHEPIFEKVLRKLIVPKVTDIVFKKDIRNKRIDMLLEINYKFVPSAETPVEASSEETSVEYNTDTFPHNRIFFGAPGTGKSFLLNKDKDILLQNGGEFERATFHPDYSYGNFVGTYKPVPVSKTNDEDDEDEITYKYVPGPFMRLYVKAVKNREKPCLLIIEEINRANVAAVFGDVFQLLDRNKTNESEYPIQISEDIKKYLAEELEGEPEEYQTMSIPSNMFIWATMNSADQGVFPMDTAFKRRWSFKYIGIDDSAKDMADGVVILGTNSHRAIRWNSIRKSINDFLAQNGINEDKQMGPYFISRNIVVPKEGNEINQEAFSDVFKNKVIMYLFEDAAKSIRKKVFKGNDEHQIRYSEICETFNKQGLDIFCDEIKNKVDKYESAANK